MAAEAISSQLKRLHAELDHLRAGARAADAEVSRTDHPCIKRYVCYLSSVLLPEQSLFATSGEARQVGDLLQDRIRFEAD